MSIIYNWNNNGQPPLGADQLIRRSQDMIPYLREQSEAATALRSLPAETMSHLRASGVARLLQPARFGGAEADIGSVIDVLVPISSGCPSTAWCLIQYLIHNFMIARWPIEAQEKIWQQPDVLVSGTIIPKLGRATPADGGFRVSGRWPFLSGVTGSEWCLVAAMVERASAPDEEYYFVVKTSDAVIHDTWHSVGLKGSGSHDIEVSDLFVPSFMALPMGALKGGPNPGSEINKAQIFEIPVHMMLGLPFAASLIGMAESMFELLLSQSRKRRSLMTDQETGSYATHQMIVGEISASLQAAQALLRADAVEIMSFGERRQLPNALERSNYRSNGAYCGELARRSAQLIWDLVGARGVYENNRIATIHQDILVASRHLTLNLHVNATEHGRARLRLPLTSSSL